METEDDDSPLTSLMEHIGFRHEVFPYKNDPPLPDNILRWLVVFQTTNESPIWSAIALSSLYDDLKSDEGDSNVRMVVVSFDEAFLVVNPAPGLGRLRDRAARLARAVENGLLPDPAGYYNAVRREEDRRWKDMSLQERTELLIHLGASLSDVSSTECPDDAREYWEVT